MINSEYIFKKYQIPKELWQFLLTLFAIYEVRGTLDRINGIKYELRTKEKGHNRPHIHASYGEFSVSISIDANVEVLEGNLPLKKKKEAINFVKDNIIKIRKNWNDIHIDMELPLTTSALLLDVVKN